LEFGAVTDYPIYQISILFENVLIKRQAAIASNLEVNRNFKIAQEGLKKLYWERVGNIDGM
jgi:hypothetical protein